MRKNGYILIAALAASTGAVAINSIYSSRIEAIHQQVETAVTGQESSARLLKAQTKEDITAQYIENNSFESDDISSLTSKTESADGLRGYEVSAPSGWTLSGNADKKYIVTKDCYTDNNFGKVTTLSDGSQAFYMRMGWSTGSVKLSQTVKSLPAGKYLLTLDQRTGYANSASSSFKLSAAGESVSETFESGFTSVFESLKWSTTELQFTIDQAKDVEIAIDVDWLSGGSCIMLDNVRLYKVEGEADPVVTPDETSVSSPTEGVITHDFVSEAKMKSDLLQMLATFSTYMKNDFQDCAATNSVNEACGCFKGENTMGNNEQGVRPNADLSMICAFLYKYGKDKVTLPDGVTWDDIKAMAKKSLVFAYSTHKANKLKTCTNNTYWGSVSNSDHVWESSLWAMSVAYSAFFQWDELTETQKGYIEKMLKAECNYELERSIPTGYSGDTKAEENGWETNILAATLGLFPDDDLAEKWFKRLREFAINCYSHKDDASNTTVIDPEYDNTTVADLYKGQNLYSDYTLQNHNLFHTSYQNVVMQELGESALALKLFQLGTTGTEKWKTNALMHNNQKVMDEVLNWLALADGELAMPNGNDWSLFLYDQITSYTTMACFLKDPNALMLENLAYKNIKARQSTTTDGSWLLRADVGARRMGVEAHRVMMTWLMHEANTTADLTPTSWNDFNKTYAEAKILPAQNVVRATTDSRFSCFSWSTGLSSYTGYIASNTADKNKIIVPYRANNTGNILGYYTVSGKSTNATPVVSGVYELKGNSYTMNGELNTNDAALNNRFAVYSTPGNAYIYIDYVRANSAATISKEQGGLMAISTDPFTKATRTIYTPASDGITHIQSDGKSLKTFTTNWANIDNEVGFVSVGDKQMAFGEQANNNSILTSKFYTSYSTTSRSVKAGEVVDKRNMTYYSSVSAATTKSLADNVISLADSVPEGWNGVIVQDPDSVGYMLLSNFVSDEACTLSGITMPLGAPVFSSETSISDGKASATFKAETNHSVSDALHVFLKGNALKAVQDPADSCAAFVQNESGAAQDVEATIIDNGKAYAGTVRITNGQTVRVSVKDGALYSETSEMPKDDTSLSNEGYTDITANYLKNPSFEEDETYGKTGSASTNGATYSDCYINSVKPIKTTFPNILPVSGWVTTNTLSPSSNYARNYSMPYSGTKYCVSPSSVGNYAAQCFQPLIDDSCGVRCLTVLNSWTTGTNKLSQTISLPEGDYRILIDMKYECPNQESNSGTVIVAGSNTNTSLTGVSVGSTTDYRYPSERSSWQTLAYDFTLTDRQEVTVSLGFKTSASVGAANNTLLYIDNVRLLGKDTNKPDGISAVHEGGEERGDLYSLQGVKVKSDTNLTEASELEKGIYILNNKKILVK